MVTNNQTVDELTAEFHAFLRTIRRSEKTIRLYLAAWKELKYYMASRRLKVYTSKIGQAFLIFKLGNYQYKHLRTAQQNFVSKIEALGDFQNTGKIILGKRPVPPKTLIGPIGETMKAFIDFRKKVYSLSKVTITGYLINLHAFNSFLAKNGIRSVTQITQSLILDFIKTLNPSKPAARHVLIYILRNYTQYLFENGLIRTDYWRTIPSDNYRQQTRLPSTFTREEIDLIVSTIDRASPKGKRDYAMFLLALKLGLRSSDIANLKFEHLSWQTNELTFDQVKTGRSITLPILPEIGNCLIDYLKYGRPVSSEPYCFLQVVYPYQKIVPHDLANALRVYLKRARINLSNRKHGPHALRHTFASALLSQETPLPVISEALGHSTSLSTMFYLRIDKALLKQCALEIPHLSFSFYKQKGGYHE